MALAYLAASKGNIVGFQLRTYQQEAVDAVLTYCRSLKGNPLVVLPTASGKSIVIAKLAELVSRLIGKKKILVLAHRKELIQQNAAKIEGDVGIYHAGIGRYDTENNIIVAGIQSLARNADKIKNVGLIIVDECHLISLNEDSQYRKLFEHYGVRVIGFTATPYRLDGGFLHIGASSFFDDIVYEKAVKEMMDEGYLCKLVSKVSILPDLSNVKVRMGDYIISQLEEAMIDTDLIHRSMETLLAFGELRRQWLLFSPSIKHAEIITDILNSNGICTQMIIGETNNREVILEDFHMGRIQCLVNVDVLTTGFDEPSIDLIGMFRPTMSTGLYYQMVGRGLRVLEGKKNCLILDYAGNIAEHGPLDKLKVVYNPKTNKSEVVKYEFRVCPVCETVNGIELKECEECGYGLMTAQVVNHAEAPEDIDIMSVHKEPAWKEVTRMSCSRHKGKNGKKDTLKIEFSCGFPTYTQYLGVESIGYAKRMALKALKELRLDQVHLEAIEWWGDYEFKGKEYVSAIDFLADNHARLLRRPVKLLVDENGKYPDILSFEFEIEVSGDSVVVGVDY